MEWSSLANGFVLPLMSSPFLALAGSALLYPTLRLARRQLGIQQETCICLGEEFAAGAQGVPTGRQALRTVGVPSLARGTETTCRVHYRGAYVAVQARPTMDKLHFLSAGAVSFARGVNDTPKIAALLLMGELVAPGAALVSVGTTIAAGGLISARRVARTMSRRVTSMNPGQGFVANIVTAGLVVGASRLGLPVSTTHVSCGSLFGIGAVTRQARWRMVGRILLAWITSFRWPARWGRPSRSLGGCWRCRRIGLGVLDVLPQL